VQIWNSLAEVPEGFGPSVATLGNFDGVHKGHQFLIKAVVGRAVRLGAMAVAVTFYPHPAVVHRPNGGLVRLQPLSERLAALAQLGLDAVLVVPYSLEFSRLTPFEFSRRYLSEALGVCEVVVGRDTKFGADNSGDLNTMRQLGEALGFEVTVVDNQGDSDGKAGERWSSSAVRQALVEGDAAEAARILGRPHRVSGKVVRGDGRGRQLGFPTANLSGRLVGLLPADGVYAGYLSEVAMPGGSSGCRWPAAISVGMNSTFDGQERRVEAHVIGRDDLNLYGQMVTIEFVARLRHMLTFASEEALVAQMHDDVKAASRVLFVQDLVEANGCGD
jgi:riboflavin kinase/FMN adenylyltransferase